jgi:hypothetical protein
VCEELESVWRQMFKHGSLEVFEFWVEDQLVAADFGHPVGNVRVFVYLCTCALIYAFGCHAFRSHGHGHGIFSLNSGWRITWSRFRSCVCNALYVCRPRVCMYVCMYVCLHVCTYVHIGMYVCMYV